MNKRSVNISSLVILLSLLSFLFEMCLYYFIPQHLITVAVAAIISLGLAHFFLESSLNYDYCFLHASFMTITSTAFTIIVYLMQPNVWIAYDYSLIALIIVNWFIPFGYCFIRDFCDRGPRFAEYLFFFYGMSILFLIIYAIALVKLLFVTPLLPPYACFLLFCFGSPCTIRFSYHSGYSSFASSSVTVLFLLGFSYNGARSTLQLGMLAFMSSSV